MHDMWCICVLTVEKPVAMVMGYKPLVLHRYVAYS